MTRTTKANVESAFKHLCQALDKRIATHYGDVGAWQLRREFCGWNIHEITTEGGGIHQPFGPLNMTSAAFYDTAWFAIRAVEMTK